MIECLRVLGTFGPEVDEDVRVEGHHGRILGGTVHKTSGERNSSESGDLSEGATRSETKRQGLYECNVRGQVQGRKSHMVRVNQVGLELEYCEPQTTWYLTGGGYWDSTVISREYT